MVLAISRKVPPDVRKVADGTVSFMTFSFQAMGTNCRVDYQPRSAAAGRAFESEVRSWVESFESRFSFYRPDSFIGRLNDGAGHVSMELDAEGESLFALCDWFYWTTKGIFDPAVVPLARLWDYHASPARCPADDEIGRGLALSGWSKVRRNGRVVSLPEPGMGVDLGGIGKEYSVDRVVEMARKAGIENIIVNFGNDLRVSGCPPEGGAWKVGLQDPNDPGSCWGGVAATNRAVATSGDYLRFVSIDGVRYGHIIDPRTGRPVRNGCEAVSVVAPTCTEAGVLSTAAFILGEKAGLDLIQQHPGAEGCVVRGVSRSCTGGFEQYEIRHD